MRTNLKLEEMIQPIVNGLGYELLGVEYLPAGKHTIIRMFIDHESGITLDDCEKVSHQVSGVMDVEEPINGKYVLEVSSPGLDRPLFTQKHFTKFIHNKVKIRLNMPIEGRRKYIGLIEKVNNEGVTLVVDDSEVFLPFDTVERANLVVDC